MYQEKPLAYACGACKIIHKQLQEAESCCMPSLCEKCKQPAAKYHILCKQCEAERNAAKELEIFEKAPKVKHHEGMVFDGDKYFNDLDAYLDYIEDNEYEMPDYVWACEASSVSIDVDRVLEDACQDMFEGVQNTLVDVDELRAYIEQWNAKQPKNCWYSNGTAILLKDKT